MPTEAQLLAGDLSLLTVLAGIAVCFFAGALGGLSGYGAGMIVTLFLAPIVGPKVIVPMMSVLMLINNGSRVWFYRRSLDLPTALRIAAVAVPMAWLGAQVYVRLDSASIQATLGVVLILSVPLRRWLDRRKIATGVVGTYTIGATYGFLASITVGAGMLIMPMLMGLGFAGAALLATDAAIAVLVNVAKAIIFGSLGALTIEQFVLALLLGVCTIPGTACAAWVVTRTSLRIHTFLVEGLILVGGASLMLGAMG